MGIKQKNFEDTKAYKLGKMGEDKVIKYLQERGWYVVPSRDYNKASTGQKAPCLQGRLKGYVLPDLDASHPSKEKRRWIEVKTREVSPRFRNHGFSTHGIAARHYQDYRAVHGITKAEVWLLIYEYKEENLLQANLFDLDPYECQCRPCRRGDPNHCKMTYGGMVFFNSG